VVNGTGTVGKGGTVQLSVNFTEAVDVAGTPSISLNDNGTATYVSGSGTNTLQFDYKVAAGQNTPDLAITSYNLSGVKDQAGNSVNLVGAPTMPAGTLAISTSTSATNPSASQSSDPTAPQIQWVAANGPGVVNGTGTVGKGGTVRLSVNFTEPVDVAGTPSISLNDNGTAKYVSGSGTNTLQFDYKVAAGQNTPDLAITGYNLSGVKDQAGNSVNLAGAPTMPAGTLAINTTTASSTATSSKSSPTPFSSVTMLAANASGISSTASAPMASTTSTPPAGPNIALLSQYAASSFAGFAPGVGGSSSQNEWTNPMQTLAKPMHR
jgi:roadblock/LC7 domain-containing protein